MNNWKQISSKHEIEDLLNLFGGFHDGCIRDIYLTTKQRVDNDLSMTFDNEQEAIVLFQRQFKNPTVIELRFSELERLNFNPPDDGIIYDCTLELIDGTFFWADEENCKPDDNSTTWISSRKLFWRERPELIGTVKRLQ